MKINIAKEGLNVNLQDYSLLTDLYQLTMATCYTGEGIATKKASFSCIISFASGSSQTQFPSQPR
jgi:nicotinic acid phosphoribosyltransferase